jgi:NADPH2:quinone reductase
LQEQWQEFLPLLESGQIDPILGSVFDLDNASSALASLETRQATGKTLLRVRD